MKKQEVLSRMSAVSDARQKLDRTLWEIEHSKRRINQIPVLIDELPAEVPGGRSLESKANLQLQVLQDRVRQYESIYSSSNPLLISAREELMALEFEVAQESDQPTKPIK